MSSRRNFLGLRLAGLVLGGILLLGWEPPAARAAGSDDPASAPGPFAAEVHYNFRERLTGSTRGGKQFSAPAHEREALALPKAAATGADATRTVQGTVPHLPYTFTISRTHRDAAGGGTLLVDVRDNRGKSLRGFPQKSADALTATGDASRQEIELPLAKLTVRKVERTLLARGQRLTRVVLVLGADDDFLSQPFPK